MRASVPALTAAASGEPADPGFASRDVLRDAGATATLDVPSMLIGTNRSRIVRTANWLLTNTDARRAMTAAGNPFGDGHAAERAKRAISWLLNLRQCPAQ